MKRRGPRAPNGSAEYAVPFRADEKLGERIVKAAKGAGTTVVEWLREAARQRLDRDR